MKLHQLKIKNFRKLKDVVIPMGDATFLIGANNAGKTSTLDALEILLSDTKKIDEGSRSKKMDAVGEEQVENEDIIIEGEFRSVDAAILNQRGFNKERLFTYTTQDGQTEYGFNYRVRCSNDGKIHREIKLHKQSFKAEYNACITPQDYIDLGIDTSYFDGMQLAEAIPARLKKDLQDKIPELWDIDPNEEWFENPGGITGNVLSRLPRFLKITASSLPEEINDRNGSMQQLLAGFFEDVRNQSANYTQARDALIRLGQELDPNDETKPFGTMMAELNSVVGEVFPQSHLDVAANLSSPESLKPSFTINMQSNVSTEVSLQGTGMIRSVVFALLKFRKQRETGEDRDLIIGFEEPELFLHPNAANSMRDTIYKLAVGRTQIISTTHSPYMIDLSQHPNQILNSYSRGVNEYAVVTCFNHTASYLQLHEDERIQLKMIQKIDDYVARVFFARKIIVVEGDTEDVVLRHTISIMPEGVRKIINADYQIVKARGKATMISFVKYLKALNVNLYVIHDADLETPGAAIMNQPILESLGGNANLRYMMHNCIEDELGYAAPLSEKPYRAYCVVRNWHQWADVPERWKNIMRIVFSEFLNELL